MIIYIEGIPASGKTSVIKSLASKYPTRLDGIPEYIDVKSGRIAEKTHNQEYFMQNDTLKWRNARKSKKEFVLVDRGHLSTLIYSLAEFKFQNTIERLDTYSWYIESILRNKRLPDKYLIFKNEPRTSMLRRQAKNNSENMWDKEEVLEYCNTMYLQLIKKYEKSIPMLIIDTSKLTLNQIEKKVITLVNL